MSSPQRDNALIDDSTLAVILGALVGLCVLVHLGAVVAAALFGDGSLGATPNDSLQALVRLPAHFSNPASAWSGVATQRLPGAVPFWLTQFILLGSVGAIAGVIWRRIESHRRGRATRLGVQSNGGLARSQDLALLRVSEPQAGRLSLGYIGRNLVAGEPQASLAVVGPTGCGKTAGFAIPALLEWSGPIIATSAKADLIAATLAHRQRQGKVWIYDPTACSGQPGSSWTPLVGCASWAGAQRTAALLCEAAQPRLDTVSDGDYWYTQARKALGPYLFAAANSGHTIADVVAWIDSQEREQVEVILRKAADLDREIEAIFTSSEGGRLRTAKRVELEPEVLAAMRNDLANRGGDLSEHAKTPVSDWPSILCAWLGERLDNRVDPAVRVDIEADLLSSSRLRDRLAPLISVQSLWSKDARLRDSVFATIENVLFGYSDPAVSQAAFGCDIDFEEWLSGDNTIYVVAASHDQAQLRPVFTVLVQQAIRGAYDSAMRRGGTLEHPCLVLLDEAGNTAPLRDLPTYASTARSHGITLVSVWQDIAQVKAIYSDRAQTVLNNHRAKLFGTGIADGETLEYVSKLIGEVPETEHNYSRDLSSDRRSVSEHTTYRRAAPVDLLRRIKTNEAVLVYGSELPAHVRLRPWFGNPTLRARSTRSITTEEVS